MFTPTKTEKIISVMMIRQFKILATGQIYDGFYLQDSSGDVQCLTDKGHQIFFEWEFELVT